MTLYITSPCQKKGEKSVYEQKDRVKILHKIRILLFETLITFQMQKELLDTELDLYKKMQAGEEVTELRRKYTELQLEVCLLQPHS